MVGTIIMGLGTVVALVGGIWLLVIAFKEHVGWGLACLFIPGAALVFAIMKWNIAKTAFLIALAGGIVSGVGSYMTASAAMESANVNMAELEQAMNEAAAEAKAAGEAAGEAAEEAAEVVEETAEGADDEATAE